MDTANIHLSVAAVNLRQSTADIQRQNSTTSGQQWNNSSDRSHETTSLNSGRSMWRQCIVRTTTVLWASSQSNQHLYLTKETSFWMNTSTKTTWNAKTEGEAISLSGAEFTKKS